MALPYMDSWDKHTYTITSTVPNSTTYDSGGHTFVDPNVIWASSAEGVTASIPVNTVIVGIQEVYLPLTLKNH